MNKMWLLLGLVAGLVTGMILPLEYRAKLSEPLATRLGRLVEQMPNE